jgi:sulfotransferase
MKKIHFLSGLPRSGNTLISSILNQNPNITAYAESILPETLCHLHNNTENSNIYRIFPDEKSFQIMMEGIPQNYYYRFKSEHIIDRGAWGLEENLNVIKKYITKEPKFIILVRDIFEILASFIRVYKEHIFDVTEFCHDFLNKGKIPVYLNSIENIINTNQSYVIIKYNDLVNNPRNEIKKVYNFLEIEEYTHNLIELKDLNICGVKYLDGNIPTLHKIKKYGIEKSKYLVEDYVPQSIRKTYNNLNTHYKFLNF